MTPNSIDAPRLHRALLLFIAGVLLLLHTFTLLRYPFPFVDEAWFAARAWAWLQNGVPFGPLDRGIFDDSVQGYQVFPFLFTALQAHSLTSASAISLIALRAVSLACGVLLLLATYVIGTRLYDCNAGMVGVVLVALSRPFWLSAHLARPDIITAMLGYASIALLLTTRRHPFWRAALCGVLVSIAFEFHPNGSLFALPLGVLALWQTRMRRQLLLGLMAGGFLGIVLYTCLHVLPNITAYRATMQSVYGATHTPPVLTGNLRLLALSFIETIRWVPQFYGVALYAPWVTLLGVITVAWGIRRARHAADLQLFSLILAIGFGVALLMRSKNNYYAIMVSPALDIGIGVALLRAWNVVSASGWWRVAQRGIIVGVVGINLYYLAVLVGQVEGDTAYKYFVESVSPNIPAHATVMGGSVLWLAKPNIDIYVPFALAHYLAVRPSASVGDALARFKPTIYILDDETRQAFARMPQRYDELLLELEQHATLLNNVTVPASGRASEYRIYQLDWTTH